MFPVTAEIEIPKIGSISGTVENRGSGEIKHDSAKIFEEDFQKWIELFWESSSNLKIGTAAGWVLSLRGKRSKRGPKTDPTKLRKSNKDLPKLPFSGSSNKDPPQHPDFC